MVPLRPPPHFTVDHLIYQIPPVPSLFSVWVLLLFPSTSGDLFPHSPHYGRSDMVQISRFRLWESSWTLCPFWMLIRELLVWSHWIKWQRKEACGERRSSSWVLAQVPNHKREARVVVFLPLWPALSEIAWVSSSENSRPTEMWEILKNHVAFESLSLRWFVVQQWLTVLYRC